MIQPKVSIKGDFSRVEKLKAAVKKADGSYYTLGVHEDAGKYPATRRNPNPPAVGEVAWWLEKGTKFMPARPFLYPAINENLDSIKKKLATGLAGIAFHGWTVRKGLTLAALHCLILLQNKVKSNVGPHLSGSWDPARGYLGYKRKQGMGMRTLIATGLLFRSLGYKIVLAEGTEDPVDHGNAGQPADASTPAPDHAQARARAREEAGEIKAVHSAQRAAHAQRQAETKRVSAHRATNATHKKNRKH